MKKIFALFFLLVFISNLFLTPHASAANGWTETLPAGSTNRDWQVGGMSDSGQSIIMGVGGGRLYFTSNGGGNWTEKQPAGNTNKNWRTACLSGDGTTSIAGVDGGRLYLSTDSGSNFSEVQPRGNTNSRWRTCAISDNGQRIWVGTDRAGGYLSTNGGSSWAADDPPDVGSSGVYFTASMNSDGQTLMVGTYDQHILYLSTDGGGTWGETNGSVTNAVWNASAMSDNGQKLIAAQDNGRVYLSTNSGSNWTEVQPNGDQDFTWNWLAMSDNGATILAANNYGLFFSKNSGSSWSQTSPTASGNDENWGVVAISSDATNSLAAMNSGKVWLTGDITASGGPTATPTSTPTPTPTPSSSGGGLSSGSSSNDSTSCTAAPLSQSSNLFQIDANKNSVTLYFSPVSGASNYLITYGLGNKADQYNVQTNQGASTGVLSYKINSLNTNTVYSFAVTAQKDCVSSAASNTMTTKTGQNKIFYKSFVSQIISSVIPKKVTALNSAGPATKTSQRVTKSNSTTPAHVAPLTSPKPTPLAASAAKKSCFLFICW